MSLGSNRAPSQVEPSAAAPAPALPATPSVKGPLERGSKHLADVAAREPPSGHPPGPHQDPPPEDPGVARVIEQLGWPPELFSDAAKQPRLVTTREKFLDELLLGNHLNDVVVFPRGIEVLGLTDSIPTSLLSAATASHSVRGFLQRVPPKVLATLKARVYYTERGADEAWDFNTEAQLRETADGSPLTSLEEKARELERRPDIADRHMYIAELRKLKKYRHPVTNEWVKTAISRDVKDSVPVAYRMLMPYWDVWDEGVFVGGACSGSPLHVDQVSWSNIGKNFLGYKVLVIWDYGPSSFKMLEDNLRMLFVNQDDAAQMDVLRSARKIAIVRPGDVILFSGANPHTAMCIGDGLSVTAYESFVNLNPVHAEVFIGTRSDDHFDECWADTTDVEDIFDDAIDTAEDALEYMERTAVDPRLSTAFDTCMETLARHPQFRRWHTRRWKRRRANSV